jgi:hypothetical protein
MFTTGGGEHQRRIVRRDERTGLYDLMIESCKIFEKKPAEFV